MWTHIFVCTYSVCGEWMKSWVHVLLARSWPRQGPACLRPMGMTRASSDQPQETGKALLFSKWEGGQMTDQCAQKLAPEPPSSGCLQPEAARLPTELSYLLGCTQEVLWHSALTRRSGFGSVQNLAGCIVCSPHQSEQGQPEPSFSVHVSVCLSSRHFLCLRSLDLSYAEYLGHSISFLACDSLTWPHMKRHLP